MIRNIIRSRNLYAFSNQNKMKEVIPKSRLENHNWLNYDDKHTV